MLNWKHQITVGFGIMVSFGAAFSLSLIALGIGNTPAFGCLIALALFQFQSSFVTVGSSDSTYTPARSEVDIGGLVKLLFFQFPFMVCAFMGIGLGIATMFFGLAWLAILWNRKGPIRPDLWITGVAVTRLIMNGVFGLYCGYCIMNGLATPVALIGFSNALLSIVGMAHLIERRVHKSLNNNILRQ